MTNRRRSQAAFDLGILIPDDDKSIEAMRLRASALFVDIELSHGSTAAASVFKDVLVLMKEIAKRRPTVKKGSTQQKPPRKKKGPHDPNADATLLALWRHTPWPTKQRFVQELLARPHLRLAVTRRPVDEETMLRRLNRAIQRAKKPDK